MQKREGRSYVSPSTPPSRPDLGRTGRKRWQRPDVPRPAAPARIVLPSADPVVPQLDPPEPMTRLDCTALLSRAARIDLLAASLAGVGGAAS